MEREISVISFNTLGAPFMTTHRKRNYLRLTRYLIQRFRSIGQELNESNSEVIFLQEVHLYSLLFILKRKLINFPYISYKKSLYGPLGGLVIFSKEDVKEVKYINFLKRGSFKNKSIISKIIRNGLLIGKLENSPFMLINTYLTANFEHNWEEKSTFFQESQIKQIIALIQDLRSKHLDFILAGDFNIHKNGELYQKLITAGKLIDPFKDYTSPTQHAEFLPQSVIIPPRLDYIFLSKLNIEIKKIKASELFTEKAEIGTNKFTYLSDHIALCAKIHYKPINNLA